MMNLLGLLQTGGRIFIKPRAAVRAIEQSHRLIDRTYSAQAEWFHGRLPRIPLLEVLPRASEYDVTLIRAHARHPTLSITVGELAALIAVAKHIDAQQILEIGTWDGNTALNLAANTSASVVTVDLPPDFEVGRDRGSLAYPQSQLNISDRAQVGRQFRGHPLEARIHQVYGDSAQIDWRELGVTCPGSSDQP
jgi:hypothetical protein